MVYLFNKKGTLLTKSTSVVNLTLEYEELNEKEEYLLLLAPYGEDDFIFFKCNHSGLWQTWPAYPRYVPKPIKDFIKTVNWNS